MARHLTPEEKETALATIIATLRDGLSIKAACAEANINVSTYYDWKNKDSDIAEKFEMAFNFGESELLKIVKAGKPGWQAACWILERSRPQWRERKYIGPGDLSDERLLQLISEGTADAGSQEAGDSQDREELSMASRVRGLIVADPL